MDFNKLSDDELKVLIPKFEDAISAEGDMSENIDRVLLLRLLKFYNGNCDKALRRLRSNMELRQSYPNIYYNRDTLSPQLNKLIDQIEMVFLPKATADNYRIVLFRLIEFDPDEIVAEDALTVFSMQYDTVNITMDVDKLVDGEVLIFDMNKVSAKHTLLFSLTNLKIFFKYMLEVHPVRMREVHILNLHTLLDKLKILFRPFLPAKAMKFVHFHSSDSTTLYDFIPRDLLPDELGGSLGPIDTPKQHWIQRTKDSREFLLDDDQWKIQNEKKDDEPSIEDNFSFFGFC